MICTERSCVAVLTKAPRARPFAEKTYLHIPTHTHTQTDTKRERDRERDSV